MKRHHFLCSFLALTLFLAPGAAQAQETMVLDRSEEAIITGFVEDVYYNTFTIQNNQNPRRPPITVRLSDLNLDSYNNLDTLINDGMRVTVYGRLIDGNTIEARRIERGGWGQ